MTSFTTITGGDVDVERDRWGRPLIVQLDGSKVAYTRATTVAKTLSDTANLQKWAERQVALGMAERRDLQLAAATNRENRAELQRVAEAAKETAGSSAAATIGTALHNYTERMDRGEDLGYVPDDVKPSLDAYRAATAGFEWLRIEQLMVNDHHRIAGTPDRIARIGDRVMVVDLKTSAGDIKWGIPDWCIQLAIYAESLAYDVSTGTRTSIEGLDQVHGIVVHLPSKGTTCELVEIDLDHDGVRMAMDVRAWRKRKNLHRPYRNPEPVHAPTARATTTEELAHLIATAPSPTACRALYGPHQHLWTDHMTVLAKTRVELFGASEEGETA